MYVITYSLEEGAVDPAALGFMLSALVVVLLSLLRLVHYYSLLQMNNYVHFHVPWCPSLVLPTLSSGRLAYYLSLDTSSIVTILINAIDRNSSKLKLSDSRLDEAIKNARKCQNCEISLDQKSCTVLCIATSLIYGNVFFKYSMRSEK